jgi:hypothetical protein
MRLFPVVTSLAFVLVVAESAVAQDGAGVFQSACATYHAAEGGQARYAPSIDALRRFTPSRY